MKMGKCISWTIVGLIFLAIIYENSAENKDDQQIFESVDNENLEKSKRPFCNAFTGCGKKRNYINTEERQNEESTISIPIGLYRAFLRAANRDIKVLSEKINQDFTPYFGLLNSPARKRYQS